MTTKKEAEKVIRYSKEQLIENSKSITGYNPEVAIVALQAITKKEMTKEEFIAAINKFVKQEVKNG